MLNYMWTYFFVLLVVGYILFLYIEQCVEYFSKRITFTTEASWGEVEKSFLNKLTSEGKKHVESIPLRSFPSNDSSETYFELVEVKNKRKLLSDERQNEIERELFLHGMLDLYSVTSEERDKIVKIVRNEIDPVIMHMKHKYNRARPYHLDTSIVPAITPPKHPSYPSGHSTQAYFIAYLLGEKHKHKEEEYLKISQRVAENREYAGVHYKSDTAYGKELAHYLWKQYSNNKNPLLK